MTQTVGGGSTLLVETDAGEIYDRVITELEERTGEALYPGDERRMFGEAVAMVLARAYGSINDAARQTMVRYARGEVLDALAARLGVRRLGAEPARTELAFELSSSRTAATVIPAGTRATSDGSVYFETLAPCTIAPGEGVVTVEAVCTVPGEAANGIPAGEVSTLVDLVPFVESVVNVCPTEGGDDGEAYSEEGDERLRERVLLAPSRLSTAGPEKGYVYWAMAADAGIVDAAALSETEEFSSSVPVRDGHAYLGGELLLPATLQVEGSASGFAWTYESGLLDIVLGDELAGAQEVHVSVRRRMDGRVRVVVLMEDGGLPDDDVIAAVAASVNSRDVRPMTDVVAVAAPDEVEYSIDMTYWATADEVAAVKEAVEGPGGAVERYITDQRAALGRDINPDVLKTYAIRPHWGDSIPGAVRCEVREPSYVVLAPDQVARLVGTPRVEVRVESEARWS